MDTSEKNDHIGGGRRPGDRAGHRPEPGERGYHVLKAYDGMEALDLAMTKEVHLIIIDVMMPKLDGLSAIMKIRERKNLPIIVLSAKSENSDKVIGLSMGADDYVTKPL